MMRIGMVCPYSFDVPGGVQAHVLQLAEVYQAQGHHVSVLAPSSPHVAVPDYVVSGGKAGPIPYNGSVARRTVGAATPTPLQERAGQGGFELRAFDRIRLRRPRHRFDLCGIERAYDARRLADNQ